MTEELKRISIQGRTIEGTEEQLISILQDLPDQEQSPEVEEKEEKREPSIVRKALGEAVDSVPAIKALKEAPQTAAGFVEGATAGLPRIALEKTIPGLEIPRGNIQGQIGGFIAGPGKALNALGKTVNFARPVARPAIAGALEGGLGGALFPQKGLNLEERLIGGALGTGIGLGVGAGIGIFKAFQQSKQTRHAIRELEKQELNFKGTQQSKLPSEIKEEQAFLRTRKAKLIKQEKEALKKQISSLDDQLNKEAQAKAQEIKKPVMEHIKRTREELGASFDDALTSAPEQGMTVKDLRGVLDDVTEEMLDAGVAADDPSIAKLAEMLLEKSDDEIITNLQLQRLKSGMNRANAPRIGKGAVTPDDLASISFSSKITKFLKETVPRFDELSQSYAEFSNLNKFAYKRFTPKASQFEIAPGTNIIKKVAQGKANAGEKAAVELLERKTGIQFTKGAKDISKSIDDLNNLSEAKIKEIEGVANRRLRELQTQSKLAGQSNSSKALAIEKEKIALREVLDSLQGILINARRVGVGLAIAGGTGLLFGRGGK